MTYYKLLATLLVLSLVTAWGFAIVWTALQVRGLKEPPPKWWPLGTGVLIMLVAVAFVTAFVHIWGR